MIIPTWHKLKTEDSKLSNLTSIIYIGIISCIFSIAYYFLILETLTPGGLSLLDLFHFLTSGQLFLLIAPMILGLGLLMIRRWILWAIVIYFRLLSFLVRTIFFSLKI